MPIIIEAGYTTDGKGASVPTSSLVITPKSGIVQTSIPIRDLGNPGTTNVLQMLMNTNLLNEVLPSAQKQGLLKPAAQDNPALASTVNTANFLLHLLSKAVDGLTTAQLVHHSGLNDNTCRCYMRKLVSLGLVRKHNLGVEALWELIADKPVQPKVTGGKLVIPLVEGDQKPETCPDCGSGDTYYDPTFDFHKCESCSHFWSHGKNDPDFDDCLT